MEDKRFEEAVLQMAQRQTVRSFRAEPIPDEVLKNILEAGTNVASGGNLQPYSIIVERDREKAQKLAKILHYPFIGNASVNLLVLMDWHKLAVYSKCRQAPFIENYSTNHFFIAWDDAVLCAQAMETAAWLYGIGHLFCWACDGLRRCAEIHVSFAGYDISCAFVKYGISQKAYFKTTQAFFGFDGI